MKLHRDQVLDRRHEARRAVEGDGPRGALHGCERLVVDDEEVDGPPRGGRRTELHERTVLVEHCEPEPEEKRPPSSDIALAHDEIEVPGLADHLVGVHGMAAADEEVETFGCAQPSQLVER